MTGRGDILELNKGLIKNATGYDLRHLYIGSEGTLGFVTEATVQLTTDPGNLSVVLLAVPRMTDVIEVLSAFRRRVSLTAFEFFSEIALKHVIDHTDLAAPFAKASDYYVLVECLEDDDAISDVFTDCCDAGLSLIHI